MSFQRSLWAAGGLQDLICNWKVASSIRRANMSAKVYIHFTITKKQQNLCKLLIWHIFGLWEETEMATGNPLYIPFKKQNGYPNVFIQIINEYMFSFTQDIDNPLYLLMFRMSILILLYIQFT